VDRTGYFGSASKPGDSTTATLHPDAASSSKLDPQYLAGQPKAPIPPLSQPVDPSLAFVSPFADLPHHRAALRNLSTASGASSSASSLNESVNGSPRNGSIGNGFSASASSLDASPNTSGLNVAYSGGTGIAGNGNGSLPDTPPGGGAGMEPMLNFRSLAAVVDAKDHAGGVQYVEDVQAAPQMQMQMQGGMEHGEATLGVGRNLGGAAERSGDTAVSPGTVPPPTIRVDAENVAPVQREGAKPEKKRSDVSVRNMGQRGQTAR